MHSVESQTFGNDFKCELNNKTETVTVKCSVITNSMQEVALLKEVANQDVVIPSILS